MPKLSLDTNILLLDANNLTILGKDTTIVLAETVLEEMDSKKSSMSELGYQAREFGRLLNKGTVKDIIRKDGVITTEIMLNQQCIEVISLETYNATQGDSYNDQKIIEATIASGDTTFMTNDVMCGLRAAAKGLKTTNLKTIKDTEFNFTKELVVEDEEVFRTLHNSDITKVDPEYKLSYYNYKFTCSTTGQIKLANIANGFISVLGKDSEKDIRKQDCPPVNAEQLLVSKSILDKTNDLVIIEGPAGSGKNIVAVSNAIKLLRLNRDKYEGITYIRAPINDESPGEDIGYLSGNDEKLAMYLGPMDDTLDFIARTKVKSKKGEDLVEFTTKIETAKDKIIKDCRIDSIISTGLRGRTLHNTIVIIDETQNNSPATTQKIFTRVGKNCKVIVIGSQRQIDNKYVNKFNNGLALLMDEASNRTIDTDLNMSAINLKKVVRSSMALFGEELFSK